MLDKFMIICYIYKWSLYMDQAQLRAFLAVADHGSFSQAALDLSLTQPAISIRIKTLEAEVGTQLFDRANFKKPVLTAAGHAVKEIAGSFITRLDHLPNKLKTAAGTAEKTVRIATHHSVMVYLLPPIISAFKKEQPEARVSVITRKREDIIELLQLGKIDIGITSMKNHNLPHGIRYEPFAKFSRILVTPGNHPLAKKKKIGLRDIANYQLLLPPLGTSTREIIDQVFKEKGLAEKKVAMEISGREATLEYIRMGQGISIINSYFIPPQHRKKLFVKDMHSYFGSAERGLLMRKRSAPPPQIKEFCRLLQSNFT